MNVVERRNSVLTHTYLCMALSLLISFLSSLAFIHSPIAYAMLASGLHGVLVFVIMLIVECTLIHFVWKNAIHNPTLGLITLLIFSAVDGATLSGIFLVYSIHLIEQAFLISTVTFGAMSATGAFMKKNLSSWERPLMGMVIALLVVWFVELFLQSPVIYLVFSGIGIIIFSVLTMVDTNKIAHLADDSTLNPNSLAIIGALALYLDFINLFIYILNIVSSFSNNN